jgi:hypothetical protein
MRVYYTGKTRHFLEVAFHPTGRLLAVMQKPQANLKWFTASVSHRGPRLWFSETPDGIVSRSLAWVGWLMLACGAAVFTLGLTASPGRGSWWVPLAVGGGFVVGGIFFVMARRSFALNWSQRTWRATHGVPGWTKDSQGTFDDFAAVVLSEHRKPGVTWPARLWIIGMTFRDQPIFIDLFLFSSREKAREKCHDLAQKMGIPAIDSSER